MAAADTNLLTGFKHYKYGSFCLQAGDIERAEPNLLKAKALIEPVFDTFTNLYMNLGNIEAQRKNYQGAIDHYERVIH
jgi:tetratricopeptide (TPR) repeat protein